MYMFNLLKLALASCVLARVYIRIYPRRAHARPCDYIRIERAPAHVMLLRAG
jgi:hypothetical protein